MQTKVLNIILFLSVVCLFISIGMLMKAMHDDMIYNREHPCIKTTTKRVCFTSRECKSGIMLPGFCITEDRVVVVMKFIVLKENNTALISSV